MCVCVCVIYSMIEILSESESESEKRNGEIEEGVIGRESVRECVKNIKRIYVCERETQRNAQRCYTFK